MTQWLILACFIAIGYIDWKYRRIPYALLFLIAVLALIERPTSQIWESLAVGAVAMGVSFLIYKVGHWAAGDIWLMGAIGLAFGLQTPYVVLVAALVMIGYQAIKKPKNGLPWGVPVAVGAIIVTVF